MDDSTINTSRRADQGDTLSESTAARTNRPRRAPLVVRLTVAVDENDAMGCTYRGLPWAFRASGQLAALSAMVANHPVIVGRASAVMGDDALALGRRTIVLSPGSRRYDYCGGHRVCIDTRPKGIPQGAEVAHSVGDALALCQDESMVYVVGGQRTFEAFLPYASAVHRFVLSGTLAFAGRTGQTTYFPPLPHGPSLVTHHPAATHNGAGYRVETYIAHPSIGPHVPGMPRASRLLVAEADLYRRLSRRAGLHRSPCREEGTVPTVGISCGKAVHAEKVPDRHTWSGPSNGMPVMTAPPARCYDLCAQDTETVADQVSIEVVKKMALAEYDEALDAVDIEQIAIRDYYDSLVERGVSCSRTTVVLTEARAQDKGKGKD